MITKELFLEGIDALQEYSNKLRTLENTFDIYIEGFPSEYLSRMGHILIRSVNDQLQELHEDYFYEVFWNHLNNDLDHEIWGTFYDELVIGLAPDWYIKRYSRHRF